MAHETEKKNSVDSKIEKPETQVENIVPLNDETLDEVSGGVTRHNTSE